MESVGVSTWRTRFSSVSSACHLAEIWFNFTTTHRSLVLHHTATLITFPDYSTNYFYLDSLTIRRPKHHHPTRLDSTEPNENSTSSHSCHRRWRLTIPSQFLNPSRGHFLSLDTSHTHTHTMVREECEERIQLRYSIDAWGDASSTSTVYLE